MMCSTKSLAYTPCCKAPSTQIRRTLSLPIGKLWLANTSRTWLVPMPKAMAPKAPWVEVWESPHATVMPGWVSPSSGAITCTIP